MSDNHHHNQNPQRDELTSNRCRHPASESSHSGSSNILMRSLLGAGLSWSTHVGFQQCSLQEDMVVSQGLVYKCQHLQRYKGTGWLYNTYLQLQAVWCRQASFLAMYLHMVHSHTHKHDDTVKYVSPIKCECPEYSNFMSS